MPADAFISFDHDDQQQVAGFRLLKSNPDCRLSRSKQSKQLRVDLLISTGRGSDFSGPLHWRFLSSSWPPILVGNPEITPRLPHHPEFSEIHAHLAFGIPECGVLPGNPSPSLEKVVFLLRCRRSFRLNRGQIVRHFIPADALEPHRQNQFLCLAQ